MVLYHVSTLMLGLQIVDRAYRYANTIQFFHRSDTMHSIKNNVCVGVDDDGVSHHLITEEFSFQGSHFIGNSLFVRKQLLK